MRRFSAEYLEMTREGMWADSIQALTSLSIADRLRILDVGCGTGEFTRLAADRSPGDIVGVDADPAHVATIDRFATGVVGDALSLPFVESTFDLVLCQALLINLVQPEHAILEFSRVSSDVVAAIEPNNRLVSIESTVDAEAPLARRTREHYFAGTKTDVSLGGSPVHDQFESSGLTDVETRRYDHVRTIEPPYSPDNFASARRKATGASLRDDRSTLLACDLDSEAYDRLRTEWRSVGRHVVEQMKAGEYRRQDTVPLYVTVGRL